MNTVVAVLPHTDLSVAPNHDNNAYDNFLSRSIAMENHTNFLEVNERPWREKNLLRE